MLGELFDALFFAAAAHQQAVALGADDVAVESLKDHFAGLFGMHDAVGALVEVDTAHGAVAVVVVLQLVVQGGPVAEVAPAEVGGVGVDLAVGCGRLHDGIVDADFLALREDGLHVAEKIGYPVILRPAFTLGGTGGGFADNETEFVPLMKHALELSPVREVLIEKSIKGFKEIEYEVMRDKNDTAITICNMENLDPVGIHTGDSIVVCPSQTLTNKEYHMLRDSALKIIRALKIEGGCNVQFALDPNSFQYYLIEVNPRVSRSSALASKASGYPIARVSAKIGIGMTLDEIQIANTPASFEPALDYVVTKLPRFPFDKFADANNALSTQMKATGEVMSIGRTFEESLLKGIRSLEIGAFHIHLRKFDTMSREELLAYIRIGTDDRIYAIAQLHSRRDGHRPVLPPQNPENRGNGRRNQSPSK